MIKRKDHIILAGFLLICVLFFSRNIFTGHSFFLRDITYLFHPWKALTAEMLQKGEMPLWNSYVFCGMPLLANWQSAVFYPFSLLFYFFDFAAGLKVFHLIQLFLAGTFAYLFAKKQGFNPASCAVIMLVFALNGYMVTRLEFLSHFSVDIWIFLILLSINNPLLLAGVLSVSFLGGHQMFFMQIPIMFLYIVFSDRAVLPGAKSALTGCAVFAAVVSAQLIPTAELAQMSGRAKAGIDFAIATVHSISFTDIFRLASPEFPPSDKTMLLGEVFSWTNTYTVGLFALLLSIRAFIGKIQMKLVLFASLLVLIGIFLSLGHNNPAYAYFYNYIPAAKMFRYPVQFMYLTVVGFSMLAAAGADKLRLKPLLVLLILLELFYVNSNFQVLAPDRFFKAVPQAPKLLQSMPGNARFILSPGTEKNRNIQSAGIVDGWGNARNYLYNLTCLPFHVSNAYGYGEPLTVSAIESMVNNAYVSDSPQAALPYYRDMGIQYLLCKNPLTDSRGYKIVKHDPPYIYKIRESAGKYLPYDKNTTVLFDGPGKSVLSVNFRQPSVLIWKETFYPGWNAYSRDGRIAILPWKGIFRQMALAGGKSNIYQVYRPFSFRIGVYVSLLALSAVLLFLTRSILRRRWENI